MIHVMVCWPLLDRYFDKLDCARASVGYLAKNTGLTRGSIATATADLVEWGYFTRRMGGGTRPSEYVPNWKIGSVPPSQDAKASVLQPRDSCVLQPQDANVLQPQDASGFSVLPPRDQIHLLEPVENEVINKCQTAPAAGAGLAAAPREGVDRLEVEIVAAAVSPRENGDQCLAVDMKTPGDEIWSDEFILHSDDQGRQDAGWKRYGKLTAALDFVPDEAEALIGRRVVVLDDRRATSFGYAPLLGELAA